MSKWIVQLDYEFGEFEPNSIYFRRVCSDDVEYSSAYDTKKEALEAFCQGQYAINQLRKEREAEQKKEDEPKEAEQKPEERIDVVRDFSPEGLEKRFGCWNEAIREAHKSPIEKQFEKIEQRLTEIEGVLSSIGSPDYDLRKKVEALEIQAKHFACYIPNVSYELKNE